MDTLATFENITRLGIFVGVFAAFAILESLFPRRTRNHPRARRWPANIGVSVLNQVVVRLLVPASTLVVAAHSAESQFGVLHQFELPLWVNIFIGIVVLDLAIYLQHVVFHAVPVLWRLHRMHHADTDFDITTGIRFHPLEIIISAAIKMTVVYLLGPPLIAVLVFEILLNATSMFNHTNLALPQAADRITRRLIVTPDMHRVHHSVFPDETNSNFGFNFPWWDHLFGTYRPQPRDGHLAMTIGLNEYREPTELRLDKMLLQPFRGDAGNYPLTRRENTAPDR